MVRKAIPLALALALLAACGTPSGTSTTQSPATGATATTASRSAAPAASSSSAGSSSPQMRASPSSSAAPSGSPSGSSSASGAAGVDIGAASAVAQQALTQLAATTGVSASNLSVQSAQPTEWNSGALGCPAPGQMYTQAIVPGYKIVMSDGTRTYDIHASQQGQVIWCDNGTPKPLPSS